MFYDAGVDMVRLTELMVLNQALNTTYRLSKDAGTSDNYALQIGGLLACCLHSFTIQPITDALTDFTRPQCWYGKANLQRIYKILAERGLFTRLWQLVSGGECLGFLKRTGNGQG